MFNTIVKMNKGNCHSADYATTFFRQIADSSPQVEIIRLYIKITQNKTKVTKT